MNLIPSTIPYLIGFGLFCACAGVLLYNLIKSLYSRPQHRECNYAQYSQQEAQRHVSARVPACEKKGDSNA